MSLKRASSRRPKNDLSFPPFHVPPMKGSSFTLGQDKRTRGERGGGRHVAEGGREAFQTGNSRSHVKGLLGSPWWAHCLFL